MVRKILFALILITIVGYFFVASVNFILATDSAKVQFEKGLDITGANSGYLIGKESEKNFPMFIGNIIGYILTFLGVIFLVLVIYGGYIWMMAKGNEQEVEKAKDILKNVIIGLIIILAAYAIVYGFNTYIGSRIVQPAAEY